MHFRFSVLLFIAAFAGVVGAQQPPRAPRETTTVAVRGQSVSINYGRPSLAGRTFDELLKKLPEDRMWRIGANQVTTLTTETDLAVGSTKIPAGKYSLYVYVSESGDYQLAINKDPGIELNKLIPKIPSKELWPRLDGYDKNIKDQEVARIVMKQATAEASVDPFLMVLTATPNGALLKMSWGNRSWTAEFK
jgi:hypothetical protein